MKRTITLLLASVLAATNATAQVPPTAQTLEQTVVSLGDDVARLKRLKISGYIQGQWQWGEQAASMKVGTANEDPESSFNRIGIRRGRIKFAYEHGLASAVFQLDITEKGVGFKDAYLNMKDPWLKSLQLRAGIFDRPFGYEIGYSSSRRESPERSTVFQTLFPDERDLGAMLVIQAPASSPLNMLKLEAGLFAGNGIKPETDSKKDFIGHLSAEKSLGCFAFGAGASCYVGRVYQGTANVYTMSDKSFVLDDNAANAGKFALRRYVGFDARISVKSPLGTTQLRGEYLFGRQPGTASGSKSPNDKELPSKDTHIRDFSGGYAILVQDLGTSPVALVAKYDWYDPNTEVSDDEVGANGTTKADISRNTLGVGALWNINSSVRLTAYYEFNKNEKSSSLEGMGSDLKDDLLTLRLQYKF